MLTRVSRPVPPLVFGSVVSYRHSRKRSGAEGTRYEVAMSCGRGATNRRGEGTGRAGRERERGLQSPSEVEVEALAVAPAELELRAVLQHHDVLAVEVWLELADSLQVDDGRAVDAREALRVQLRLDGSHCLAEEMSPLAHVYPDVVASGLDPVDLFDRHHMHAPAALDEETVDGARLPRLRRFLRRSGLHGTDLGQDRRQLAAECALSPLSDAPSCARERLGETLVVDGLEEVVERVGLEGPERVLTVRGDKDVDRHLLGPDHLHDAEAVEPGHLHIEEDQVGRQFRDH